MNRHLKRVRVVRHQYPRPAKVVQLEVRRQLRLEAARPYPQPPKAA